MSARKVPLAFVLACLSLVFTGTQAWAQDKANKNVHIQVLTIQARGKTVDKPSFDSKIKHLAKAFKSLTFKEYKLDKKLDKSGPDGSEQTFDLGYCLNLSITPTESKGRYKTVTKLVKCQDVKQADGTVKKEKKLILNTTLKRKSGTPVALGARKVDGKDFSLLIVITVQGKPFKKS